MTRSIAWYAKRLSRMSAGEVAARGADHAKQVVWARQRVRPGQDSPLPPSMARTRVFLTTVPLDVRDDVPPPVVQRVVAAADGVLDGRWGLLGVARSDIATPDWFLDEVTGRRSPQDVLAWRIDHRDEQVTGNVKAVWELSRHHHQTLLASAWWLTGREDYATAVDEQLRSWWKENPFLSGVHWTSSIELGVRLISWVWIRRLLDDWPKVGDLFEDNDDALRQLWWHQRFLSAFPSRGSSRNNHAVAEDAGLLAASCAFPWYAESDQWRTSARRRLQLHLRQNTFDTGLNREQATDYHRFVTELALVAACEAHSSRCPLDEETWAMLASSLDAAAAIVDTTGRPPRQGDGDDGRALLLDAPDNDAWGLLLGLGQALVGAQPWWPTSQTSVASVLAGAMLRDQPRVVDRSSPPRREFTDAGMTLLRSPPEDGPEIWCRCDGGPHGFLSIAAHAHADALAVELRLDGVDILTDPGTYCYHGEPEWRSYFRSTLAHNTLEVDGVSQSVETGPFMWGSHAASQVLETRLDPVGRQLWRARHLGYQRLDPALVHTRTVTLDRETRRLSMTDEVLAGRRHSVRLAFHLGPSVELLLTGSTARLGWVGLHGRRERALLELPGSLTWTPHRGETDPVLGWYSPRFGERVRTTTLLGAGHVDEATELITTLTFARGEAGEDCA